MGVSASSRCASRAFVGSIADRGVREPVIVRRDDQGRLVVRKGQRRTLAAVQAGLDLIPVVVEPEPLAQEQARRADRIIDQLGENLHRAGLPEADEVAAHQQLLDLGLSAGRSPGGPGPRPGGSRPQWRWPAARWRRRRWPVTT